MTGRDALGKPSRRICAAPQHALTLAATDIKTWGVLQQHDKMASVLMSTFFVPSCALSCAIMPSAMEV